MRATVGKAVIVTLKPNNRFNIQPVTFKKGQLLNFQGHKRIKGIVEDIDSSEPYSHTLTIRNGYWAAPKSKVRLLSIFSKINAPILNPKTKK